MQRHYKMLRSHLYQWWIKRMSIKYIRVHAYGGKRAMGLEIGNKEKNINENKIEYL